MESLRKQNRIHVKGSEPGETLMVAPHSFDIMDAKACGYRGAYVNRYSLPTERSPYRPDFQVENFNELADLLTPD